MIDKKFPPYLLTRYVDGRLKKYLDECGGLGGLGENPPNPLLDLDEREKLLVLLPPLLEEELLLLEKLRDELERRELLLLEPPPPLPLPNLNTSLFFISLL